MQTIIRLPLKLCQGRRVFRHRFTLSVQSLFVVFVDARVSVQLSLLVWTSCTFVTRKTTTISRDVYSCSSSTIIIISPENLGMTKSQKNKMTNDYFLTTLKMYLDTQRDKKRKLIQSKRSTLTTKHPCENPNNTDEPLDWEPYHREPQGPEPDFR